jgi:hypothetical protein
MSVSRFVFSSILLCGLILSLTGCGSDQSQPNPSLGAPTDKAPTQDPSKSKAGLMNDPKKK